MSRSTRKASCPAAGCGVPPSRVYRRRTRPEEHLLSQTMNLDLDSSITSTTCKQVFKSTSDIPAADNKLKRVAKITATAVSVDLENILFNIVCTLEQNPSYALQGVESLPIKATDAFDVMNIIEMLEDDLDEKLQMYNLSHKDVVRIWFAYTEHGERRRVQHSEKAVKGWLKKVQESKMIFEGRCECGECRGTIHYPHIEVNMHGDGPAKLLEVHLGICKSLDDDTMTATKKGESRDHVVLVGKVREQKTAEADEATKRKDEVKDDRKMSSSSSEKGDGKDEDYEG